MSKDLEKELTAYVEEIKPDLWNRIEQQLPAKNISRNETQVLSDIKPIEVNREQKTAEIKEFRQKRLYRYAGILAAGIALAILIPVLVMNREELKNGSEASIHKSVKQKMVEETDIVVVTIAVSEVYGKDVMVRIVDSTSDEIAANKIMECEVADGIVLESGKQYKCQVVRTESGIYSVEAAKEVK